MKTVLVTQRLVESREYVELREALDVRWAQFFAAAELLPVPVGTEGDVATYFEQLSPCGVVLTGGGDIAAVVSNDCNLKRDQFEEQMVVEARQRGLPVLGVCRGMQFLAHLCGWVNEPVEGHVATRHALSYSGASRFLQGSDGPPEVNSFHQWAPKGDTDELIVVAQSDDGVIEAFEHREAAILGIMWHPERTDPYDTRDVELFRRFFGKGST